jgi:hypothetical protein
MKLFRLLPLLFTLTTFAFSQQEEMVSVPKSKLTDQQKADLNLSKTQSWVGMGREIGEAVNSSMAAITTQSNNFAQTPVGKLTVFIVIWKVIGDEAIHVGGGLIELLIFVPVWIWSYRRTCMTRKVRTAGGWFHASTWQVVPYDADDYGDCTPRIAHLLAGWALIAVTLITVFSY